MNDVVDVRHPVDHLSTRFINCIPFEIVVSYANLSNRGLNNASNHFYIAMVGDFRPAIIGLNGVPGLCALGKK
jgi:hypothetical protein